MDEVIGFLLATKNKTGWFTTKEYVDYVAVQGIVDEILTARFTITDGELLAEDGGEKNIAQYFEIADGILQYNSVT